MEFAGIVFYTPSAHHRCASPPVRGRYRGGEITMNEMFVD